MRIPAGDHIIVLTPLEGQPSEPGRYLGLVPRYEGHRDGAGFDTVVVEWARDGRTGEVWPTVGHRSTVWTHKVTVEPLVKLDLPGCRTHHTPAGVVCGNCALEGSL